MPCLHDIVPGLIWRSLWLFVCDKYIPIWSFVRQLVGQNAKNELVKLSRASFPGSTAILFRVRPGVILKAPVRMGHDQVIQERQDVLNKFNIERQILERLGPHPRIVR
jgi:hypothetical protein